MLLSNCEVGWGEVSGEIDGDSLSNPLGAELGRELCTSVGSLVGGCEGMALALEDGASLGCIDEWLGSILGALLARNELGLGEW